MIIDINRNNFYITYGDACDDVEDGETNHQILGLHFFGFFQTITETNCASRMQFLLEWLDV